MNLALRAVAAGTVLGALTVAGLTACPSVSQDVEGDSWRVPDLRGGLTASQRRAHDLERCGEVIARRMTLRTETVEDLMAGRVGVGEAVRRFAELNRTDPRALDRVRFMYAGATDEERAGWQLVSHLRACRDPRAAAAADATACAVAYPEAAR